MKYITTVCLLGTALSALAQPIITAIAPQPNAIAAPRLGTVTATFSQPLTAGSATALKVHSLQRGGLLTRGATGPVVSGNSLSFSPAYPFKPGETVQATVTTAAAGSVPLARAQVLQFTAAVAGQGRGSFVAPATNPNPAVGISPSYVALGDIDGDGDVDLLTTNTTDGTVSVLANNGSGNFTTGQPAISVDKLPCGLALADVDNDGDLDLLTSSLWHDGGLGSKVSVQLNDGAGQFSSLPGGGGATVGIYAHGLTVGDADGDGYLDLFSSSAGTVCVRFNTGGGWFEQRGRDYTNSATITHVAIGDVDNDGDLDMVTNSNTVQLFVDFNNGRGEFSIGSNDPLVTDKPGKPELADLDGDGDLDIAVPVANGTICLRFNDGTGHFVTSAASPDLPVSASWLTVGDVDADGDLDLIATLSTSTTGTATVLLNTGGGQFAPAGTMALGRIPQIAALVDVDADGDLDFVSPNNSDRNVNIRLNGGTSPSPVLRISGSVMVCAGQSGAELTAVGTPSPLSYGWNTGATTASIPLAQPGTYTVTATFPDGQVATAQQVVTAGMVVPPFSLGNDTTLCDGGTLVLRGPSAAGLAYQWSDGSTGAMLEVSAPGTYHLRVTGCGEQTASRTITAGSCQGIPTIITPNNDGLNDRFSLKGLAPGPWTLELYSRWGQCVYRSEAYANDWGGDATPGIYYYLVRPANQRGFVYKGCVEVVR